MKLLTQLLTLLLGINLSGQIPEDFIDDFLLEDELISDNRLNKFATYDFAHVWLKNNNELVYGIIGEDHQRIQIKFLSVKKSPYDQSEYIVYGKSKVKNNICEFSGIIKIKEIYEVKDFHYGVDDEFINDEIKSQGLLFAKYAFFESENQSHSGLFEGLLVSKWYLDKDAQMRYDDIESIADGYMNNAFIGTWTNYSNKQSKNCRWADHRVPMAKQDFDIGAGEFSVSEKYIDKGWNSEILRVKYPENENNSIESNEVWWK